MAGNHRVAARKTDKQGVNMLVITERLPQACRGDADLLLGFELRSKTRLRTRTVDGEEAGLFCPPAHRWRMASACGPKMAAWCAYWRRTSACCMCVAAGSAVPCGLPSGQSSRSLQVGGLVAAAGRLCAGADAAANGGRSEPPVCAVQSGKRCLRRRASSFARQGCRLQYAPKLHLFGQPA
jgi:urease accessory protein